MADQSEYAKSLQDFAKSMNGLMAAIVESVKNNKDTNPTEEIKKLAADIADTTQMVEKINEDVKATKSNTEEILAVVKALQKEKRKGIFERLDKKDKAGGRQVVEGIKTIALMAGAILAIGKAFQVVGNVDFQSVIALSVAMPLMSIAFEKVGENIKSPKESLMIGFSLVVMSAAIAVSGGILSYMPTLGVGQMISAIGVSVAMGLAMYGLSMAVNNLSDKEVKNLYLMAPVIPIVATGILLAAKVLQDMPEVDLKNTIMTSLAVTGSTVIFALGAALISKVGSPKDIIVGTLGLVVASAGLAASSQLISLGDYSNYPSLDWATGFGVSMLLSLPSILAYGIVAATGIGALAIGAGILSMIAVSGGLSAMSHIVATGDYKGGPSAKWAAGFGLSMMAFAPAVLMFGALAATGIGALVIGAGIASMIAVGEGLAETSRVIQGGQYTGGPSIEWAYGVGYAIMAFANSMDALTPGLIDTIFGGENLESRIGLMLTLAGNLPKIAEEINKGNGKYEIANAPTKGWSEGVGTAIMAFANAMGALEPGVLDTLMGDSLKQRIDLMIPLASKLPLIAAMFNANPAVYNLANVPSKAWSEGVGIGVSSFASAIAALADDIDLEDISKYIFAIMPLAPVMAAFGNFLAKGNYTNYPKKQWAQGIGEFFEVFSDLDIADDAAGQAKQMMLLAKSYVQLAASMMVLGKGFNSIKEVPNLTGLYGGLVTLSLIDSDNLEDALDSISDKKDEFLRVMQMVSAASNVKIDDSTFAFNKDKQQTTTQQSQSRTSVKINTTPVITPTVTKVSPKDDKEEKMLAMMRQVIGLLSSGNGILGEIADNTAEKLSDMGINH
jgi:hypothetical protein